jgi:hypothetical protein
MLRASSTREDEAEVERVTAELSGMKLNPVFFLFLWF